MTTKNSGRPTAAQKAHILELVAMMERAWVTGEQDTKTKEERLLDTTGQFLDDINEICFRYSTEHDLDWDLIVKSLLTVVAVSIESRYEKEVPDILKMMIAMQLGDFLIEQVAEAIKQKEKRS